MGYRLGVDLGTTFTAAVVQRTGSAPTVVPLGDRSAALPSVMFLGEDGTVLIGDAAERRALTDPDRVVRHFKRRIGDETPLLFGAERDRLTAHALAARMIALVADKVAEREGGAPDGVAVTVPASWGPHKKQLLAAALTREGLLGATLVPEPAAAALAYARAGRLTPGATVAVYDLGGGTFDAALLRACDDGRFTVLGSPGGLPDLGGVDFDDAVLAHVLGSVPTPRFDAEDDLHVTAMARLRRECVDAKEALSADTVATVPVLLGELHTSLRLTRGEFEAMIVRALESTFISLRAALDSAGLQGAPLDRILLTGGSSRIPLVTQLLSARFPGLTIERDIDPKLAVAIGAVLSLEPPADPPAPVEAAGLVAAAAIAGAEPELATPAAEPARAGTSFLGRAAAAGVAAVSAAVSVAAVETSAAPAPAEPTQDAPVKQAVAARPERPARTLEGFERVDGPLVPQPRKRRAASTVLGLSLMGLIAAGMGVVSFMPIGDAGETLPAASLQEKRIGGSKPATTKTIEEKDVATDGAAASTRAGTTGSSGAAGGRPEGSADTRTADSGSAKAGRSGQGDASSAEVASSERTSDAREQAARERQAARAAQADAADSVAMPTLDAGKEQAVQPAPAEVAAPAPATQDAQGTQSTQAAAEDDAADTESGSFEAFNDGSPTRPESPTR